MPLSQSGTRTAGSGRTLGSLWGIQVLAAICATTLPVLMLVAATDISRLPAVVPIVLVMLLALAVVRPDAGLLAATVLVPLCGWAARIVQADSFRLAEAVVLAVLTGALIRLPFIIWSSREPTAVTPTVPAPMRAAATLFIAVTAASALVRLTLWQFGVDLQPGIEALLAHLTTDYLFGLSPDVPGLIDAARLVEGTALVLVVIALNRRWPALPQRLAVATMLGAAMVALVNLNAMVVSVWTDENPIGLLLRYLGGRTLAAHVSDINATGSYFLMVTLLGIGLAIEHRRWLGRLFTVVTALTGVTFWLAGSRAALAAALLIAFGFAVTRIIARQHSRTRLMAVGSITLLAVVALPVALTVGYPDRSATSDSVDIRTEFFATSLRMVATHPVLGVGTGRYYELSSEFMSPELQSRYPRENAHNNYMQIAAELGTVGIGAFVWFLAAGTHRVWLARRTQQKRDLLLVAAGTGAAAFLITCLTGHPLLVNETAYPFWIVGGIVVARAHALCPSSSAHPTGRRRAIALWIVCVGLVVSVPSRAQAEVDGLTLEELSSGLYGWEIERGSEKRFRWSGRHATIFVPTDVRQVRIPVRALQVEDVGEPVHVDISVAGHHVMRIPLTDRSWVEVPLTLTHSDQSRTPPRLDLQVDRTWSPARVQPGSGDGRTLGVKVGELAIVRALRE